MKAIVISNPGAPEVLQLVDRPVPAVGPRHVLIKVAAAGVNRPDIMQRQGIYPPPANASPDIPGLEISGTVVKTGSEVTKFRTGDLVCGLADGGGYADFCAVKEGQCIKIPNGLSLLEAASLPETYFTVWSNVFDGAGLQPGESLLVHGGSSSIGAAAIQLAKAFGCQVYATAGNEAKLQFCRDLGAE